VRDLHLRHTLTQLTRDAAGVFSDLVSSGQEIAYEIGEPGEAFTFWQYRPMTARFVRDNAVELRELESYREATETMRRSDVAVAYLEGAGIDPPADPHERASLAVTFFLARLWDGCSEFELDEERLTAALGEVEDCAEPDEGEVEAIVPLLGFSSPLTKIELPDASIVRADTVDVPAEAMRGERPAGASWEPTFVISARVALDADGGLAGAGDEVARTFERTITTLRLFQPGGVGLAPHGWVRVAGDRWRRIATGAGRPRSGGYALLAEDAPALVELARTISVHPRRVGRLRRALLRFEAGLDRRGAVDALNDHLLSLRFLLEGEGPAGVGLPMRAAVLAADPSDRDGVKDRVEQALAIERRLWSGEPVPAGGSAAEIASEVEELLRRILRRGVSGELGADLRVAADEALLADGLAVGEGADRGATTEWDLEPEPERQAVESFTEFDRDLDAEIRASRGEPADLPEPSERQEELDSAVPYRYDDEPGPAGLQEELEAAVPHDYDDKAELEGEPEPETRAIDAIEAEEPLEAEGTGDPAGERPASDPEREVWLAEVGGAETMDFPRADNHLRELSKSPMDRAEVKARVEYLFPRTETDWTVGGERPRRRAAAG
jgi:hypothetical protein